MKRVAVLTSGGDAPGMNAAIRSVVRTGLNYGWEMYGVFQGFHGCMTGNIERLDARDVGGILQQGGTILGSARAVEFKTEDGRKKALAEFSTLGIECLVVIGGNGSQTGAYELHKMGFPVVGVASTIDNDLYGSEITIGVDTALNIALEAIDRLKVTASSHERAFLVETMGRDCGYLALMAGIAGGAEAVVIPERETTPEAIASTIRQSYERGKNHALIVVAEGAPHDAQRLVEYFNANHQDLGFGVRATILGHVQRGGVPSAFDRILATRLGAGATAAIAREEFGLLAGLQKGGIQTTPLSEVVGNVKPLDQTLIDLSNVLAM